MRRATLTTALTKGVLDPDLSERIDLAHYYNSCAAADNAISYPQGGVGDRGGFEIVSGADLDAAPGLQRRLRQRLWAVALSAGQITAPNGGVSSNLFDGDAGTVFTTSAAAGSTFVIMEVEFASEISITFVDVVGFSLTGAARDNCLGVQYWDGAAWVTFGGPLNTGPYKNVRTSARNRRFGGWPGYAATASVFRIVLIGAAGAGLFSMSGLRMWRESHVLSPVAFAELPYASGSYELVVSDRNVDIFKNRRWLSSAPAYHVDAQQVRELNIEAARDTVLLFHGQVQPLAIQRQGEEAEWSASPVAFSNVPALTAGAPMSDDTNENQVLTLEGIAPGDFAIFYLGADQSIQRQFTDEVSFAAEIVTALESIPGVAAGQINVTSLGGDRWSVGFVGADNGARFWPLLSASVVATNVVAGTLVNQMGIFNAGALFGVRTGWPRCGALVQGRLVLGGFRSSPSSFAASRLGLLYDFQTNGDPLTADMAFVRSLDIDTVETVHDIYVGRHLQLFTESTEWFVETRTLDATKEVNVVLATRNGIAPAIPIAFVEGASVFVQKGGRILRDFIFSDVQLSYTAEPLSLLGPHLLTDVVDMACRPARSVTDGNLLFMVNADGSMAVLTVLRAQEVAAMNLWRIDGGLFRNVMVGADHDVRVAVEMGGGLKFMRWMPEFPLDGAVRKTGSDIVSVAGLGHLAGKDVYCYANGDLLGPFTVSGGAITLDEPVTGTVVAGIEPDWFVRLQPLRERLNNSQPFRPPSRIYEVELALVNTGGVSIAANGQADWNVPLLSVGGLKDGGPLQTPTGGRPDLPVLQRLYTGYASLQGMLGWTEHPYVTLRRPGPVPVHVKAIRYEVATHG